MDVSSSVKFRLWNAHHDMGSLKSRGYISGQAGYGDRAAVPLGKGAGKANVFRILIAVVAVFFLVETIANGLVFLKMRDSDLQGGSLNFFTRASETKTVRPGDDVRFVPRLLLSRGKATMAELRRELRTPVRPPSLAFVCTRIVVYLQEWSLFIVCSNWDNVWHFLCFRWPNVQPDNAQWFYLNHCIGPPLPF